MAIITFSNRDKREVGQTLSVAAIASCMALEHNYKILVISTDFDDKSLETCFFRTSRVASTIGSMFGKSSSSMDVANGVEGLIRLFASNHVDMDVLGSYTRPVLKDRLDILPGLKTKEKKEYANLTTYFSQIAEAANRVYDIVFVDTSDNMPLENVKKLYNISTITIMSVAQNQESINEFKELKAEEEFYLKNSVMINVGKCNDQSRFTAKNIGRELGESFVPYTVPYNIHFADSCSDSKIIDYLLKIQHLAYTDGDDGKFYQVLKDTAERMDYQRTAFEFGTQLNQK